MVLDTGDGFESSLPGSKLWDKEEKGTDVDIEVKSSEISLCSSSNRDNFRTYGVCFRLT